MKIAIYHPWIYTKGGCERVILELVKRLQKHKCTIFTHYYNPLTTFPEFKNFDVKVIGMGFETKKLGFLKRGLIFGLNILTTKIKDLKNYDVFVVSTAGVGELITIKNHDIKTVCYCHTPLRAAHEFYNQYKKSFGVLKKILFTVAIKFYRILERKSWKYFSLIFCNSKNTKNRIEKAKLATGKKIKVIHPGIDTKNFKPNWKYKKYFFVTGRFKPYKRFELAIESFKLFKIKTKGWKMIIAGYPDDKEYFEKIKKMAKTVGDIEVIEAPTDKHLIKLYQNCYAVLFTAFNEDWGIVPIEAMACGKPVISVAEGGALESIINGKTGFLVKATPNEISKVMLKLSENPTIVKHIGRAARKHALNFDWEFSVKEFEMEIQRLK